MKIINLGQIWSVCFEKKKSIKTDRLQTRGCDGFIICTFSSFLPSSSPLLLLLLFILLPLMFLPLMILKITFLLRVSSYNSKEQSGNTTKSWSVGWVLERLNWAYMLSSAERGTGKVNHNVANSDKYSEECTNFTSSKKAAGFELFMWCLHDYVPRIICVFDEKCCLRISKYDI